MWTLRQVPVPCVQQILFDLVTHQIRFQHTLIGLIKSLIKSITSSTGDRAVFEVLAGENGRSVDTMRNSLPKRDVTPAMWY